VRKIYNSANWKTDTGMQMKSLDEAVCFLFFLMGAQRERQREDKTERERERGEK